MKLLTTSNYKTTKGEFKGYKTYILYMSPYKANSSRVNLCPFASKGCIKSCLNTSGRGVFNTVKKARQAKADLFIEEQYVFMWLLVNEIKKIKDEKFCIRLNGTTDIAWENVMFKGKNIFEHFPNVQFYDYTKDKNRMLLDIPNYNLTFSRSESNDKDVEFVLNTNKNIAVVFKEAIPDMFLGRRVINGDKDDLRFLDPAGCIVGLKAKGKGKKDKSGFVI